MPCLLLADNVVLLSSSCMDLQLSLEQLATECEAAGIRISSSKSEAMVLSWKRVECSLQVKKKVLPQVQDFQYLRVFLFVSRGRIERENDRQIEAVLVVMWALNQSVEVKRGLSTCCSFLCIKRNKLNQVKGLGSGLGHGSGARSPWAVAWCGSSFPVPQAHTHT